MKSYPNVRRLGFRGLSVFILISLTLTVGTRTAMGAITFGPGGVGVTVGSSDLFTNIDYSDTWTGTAAGGIPGRTTTGLFPVNAPGINVEFRDPFAPARTWTNSKWSLNIDSNALNGTLVYPGGTGAGSATGITQTGGGGDWGIEYGLRNEYVVQFDAVQTVDRVNITSSSVRDTISGTGGLSVFFRQSAHPTLPTIGIFRNGVGETAAPFASIVPAVGGWNNYAVRFDVPDNEIEIYVNEVSLGVVNLATFAGGAYSGINNSAVSVGAAGGNRVWTDNFQVGGFGLLPPPPQPHPNPGLMADPPAGLISYWDFDEAGGAVPGFTRDFAYDRVDGNHGTFLGSANRAPGIVGTGAATFNNSSGAGVGVGAGTGNNFSVTTGITIEAMIVSNWTGNTQDYDEIFRKEDGGNRILFSFQNDANNPGANPPVAPGPVLSFGLNVNGAYSELDMPLDGIDGRPTLAEIKDGRPHFVAATYDSVTGEKAIWVDGTKRFSVMLPAGALIISGGGTVAQIGNTLGGSEPFNGLIDEVAFWGRALTAHEIATHYANVQGGGTYFVAIPLPSAAWAGLAVLGVMGVARRRAR